MSEKICNHCFGDDVAARDESWSAFSGYLALLFEPGDVIEIRLLWPGTKKVQHYWRTLDILADLHDELCQLNDDGANVYFGFNPRTADGGTKAEDVEHARALCLDIDNGCTTDELMRRVEAAGLPEPSAAIASGGGAQAVWRLTEAIPIGRWRALQKGIIGAVDGADASIHDPPRLMRVPGFRNRKPEYGPAFPMATTTLYSNRRHDPDVFPAGKIFTPTMQPGGEPEKLSIDTAGILPAWCEDFLANGTLLPGENNAVPSRRQTAFRVAIEMKAAGFPIEEARERIGAQLRALGLDACDVNDALQRQLDNAYSKERTPTIDRDKLPTTIPSTPSPEPTIEVQAYDKQRVKVIARRGACTAVDVIDPTKANARKKFINEALRQLGDDTATQLIDDRLKAVATGDEEPAPSPSDTRDRGDFLDVSALIRPERFTVRHGDEWATGFTVPKFLRGKDGLEGVWMCYFGRSDGTKDFIELPESIEVSGQRYYFHPEIGPPAVERMWEPSAGVAEAWLRDGVELMRPPELLASLVDAFATFIELPEEPTDGFLKVLALWTVLTYSADQFPVVTFLAINGPKGSGKSRIFHCLNALVFRAHAVINPSAASLFRHLHARGGTVVIDESENLEDADPTNALMPTLLSSNTLGACVARCDGENNTPVTFATFGPKAFFSIAEPLDTLLDRAIHIRMFRAPPGSMKTALHPADQRYRLMWQRLRDALFTFSMQRAGELSQLRDISHVCSDEMFPRSRETWGPILQLADLFERLGVSGLLSEMQRFASTKVDDSQTLTVDEAHESILKALVGVVVDDIPATSGAVLKRAYAEGLDPACKLTDKAVGKILRSYGFTQHRTNRARLWTVPPNRLEAIACNYGIQLELETDTGQGTPRKTVTLSPDTDSEPTTGVKPEKNDDFGGDTSPRPVVSPERVGDTASPTVSVSDTAVASEVSPEKVAAARGKQAFSASGDSVTVFPGVPEAPIAADSDDTVSGEVEL
jgi:energy-coupling factor transporter ATP-binding protein EcfA2